MPKLPREFTAHQRTKTQANEEGGEGQLRWSAPYPRCRQQGRRMLSKDKLKTIIKPITSQSAFYYHHVVPFSMIKCLCPRGGLFLPRSPHFLALLGAPDSVIQTHFSTSCYLISTHFLRKGLYDISNGVTL